MEPSLSHKKLRKKFMPKLHKTGEHGFYRRIIGTKEVPMKEMDPFLMLEYMSVTLPGGFPDHSHRGFEAVSYLLEGRTHHENFQGNKGTIEAGGIQWVTIGKGIVHAEIPASKTIPSIGFQLWINLQKEYKMIDPIYQDFSENQIPVVDKLDEDGIKVKIMAGECLNTTGPVSTHTPVEFLDFELRKDATYTHKIPAEWNMFMFCFKGSIEIIQEDKNIILSENEVAFMEITHVDEISEIKGQQEINKFILFSGLPLKEPVEHNRNYVMNSEEELEQTISDFKESKNGFEGASTWQSEIKLLMDE